MIYLFNSAYIFSQGLEGVIVEKYFENTSYGKLDELPDNAITYRIYLDLEPEYKLLSVYGAPNHPFRFETTTTFYNHNHGNLMGDGIIHTMINDPYYALDTYITLSSCTNGHVGILLTEDNDGSVIQNRSFKNADGLFRGEIPEIVYFHLEPEIFSSNNSNLFESENFLIGSYAGVKGPTPENRILIAQLTTDGDLSFEINIQIGIPGEDPVQFLAREPVAEGNYFEDLSYGLQKQNE
ncbi:MAG: hypothetical protein ACP5E3_19375 [Bacteroidales bacterium]